MNIVWAVGGVVGDWAQGFQSPLASNRYRAIIPASELRRLGHACDIIDFRNWSRAIDERLANGGTLVVGKFLPKGSDEQTLVDARSLLANVQRSRTAGVRVAVDFCDDWFNHVLIGETWRELARMSSVCIAGSEEMAARVSAHTAARVRVIGDPLASPMAPARVFRRSGMAEHWLRSVLARSQPQRLRFVWYGHPSNWSSMQRWAEQLAVLAREQPWVLNVVSTLRTDMESFAKRFNEKHAPAARVHLHEWNEQVQWEVVSESDVVLLPNDVDDVRKTVKTGNRLTDALHAGRYVIAATIPAYTQFAEYVDLVENPVEAVRAYLRKPDQALLKTQRGQTTVVSVAAPSLLASHWLAALGGAAADTRSDAPSTIEQVGAALSAPPREAVRLNLGCGDKILPGYTNVDVVEARAGKSPDVMCDLHQLSPFADNHADEVLAVHVVEHFWRWEVEDVLREWVRVLRPGGRMVLECPNLRSACEAFLADPSAGWRQDARGQRTMWVFYGDPQWKDPLMVHRWGYTPESLAALMQSVGLVNARQEPAQYKLREPRDMRIVAEKPLA
jgi:SAM-dependent methyltransferase